jgi:hypothetical protein
MVLLLCVALGGADQRTCQRLAEELFAPPQMTTGLTVMMARGVARPLTGPCTETGQVLVGRAVQGICRLPGAELPTLPLQKIQLKATSARACTSPRTGLLVETGQSLAEVAGMWLLGVAAAGVGQGGVCSRARSFSLHYQQRLDRQRQLQEQGPVF